MVDESRLDFTSVHRGDDGGVLLVLTRPVSGKPVEPGGGGLLAVHEDHRRDEGEERPVAGGDAHPPRPHRIGEAIDRVGQVGGADHRAVVHHHPSPATRPHPTGIRVGEAGIDHADDLVGEPRQKAGLSHRSE